MRLVFIFLTFLIVPAFALARQGIVTTGPQQRDYQDAVLAGTITDPKITEASGLAYSQRNRDVLWVVNDSGNKPVLFAVTTKGRTVGVYEIANATNRDWEDLAVFNLGDTPYLMIADVGDNKARRDFCTLYMVAEPRVREGDSRDPVRLDVAWTLTYQYQNGPRDCEAVAVDMPQNRILLISKRTTPPALFELPLATQGSATPLIAKKISDITTIPPPDKEDLKDEYGKYRSRPTAMDVSRNGDTMIILTYKHAYIYRRQAGQNWREAFGWQPQCISLPHPNTGIMQIRESICMNQKNGDIFVTSERIPAPIYRIRPIVTRQ